MVGNVRERGRGRWIERKGEGEEERKKGKVCFYDMKRVCVWGCGCSAEPWLTALTPEWQGMSAPHPLYPSLSPPLAPSLSWAPWGGIPNQNQPSAKFCRQTFTKLPNACLSACPPGDRDACQGFNAAHPPSPPPLLLPSTLRSLWAVCCWPFRWRETSGTQKLPMSDTGCIQACRPSLS